MLNGKEMYHKENVKKVKDNPAIMVMFISQRKPQEQDRQIREKILCCPNYLNYLEPWISS